MLSLKYEKRVKPDHKEFHLSNDEIISAYTKDITVNNSRLATYKEANQNQQREFRKITAERPPCVRQKMKIWQYLAEG